jgi:Fe-S-cluster containining protein
MATVRDALRGQLIAYSCSQNCMGFRGNNGGCCTLDDRNWILGPLRDGDVDAFLVDLGRQLGREVSCEEVFIDFEEGRALFLNRSGWQKPANYPALRVRPDVARIPCRFYESSTGACTVHDIRPTLCRNYLCDHLKNVISLLNLNEEAAPPE